MFKPNKYFTNRTTLCNNEVMSTTQPSHSETQSPWRFELRHRLALTLEVSGISVQEMADHLGVSANTVGNYVASKAVTRAVGGTMRRAGVNATTHQLRHYYATELLDAGADIRVVKELMRHESIATTEIYTQVSMKKMFEGVAQLPLAA